MENKREDCLEYLDFSKVGQLLQQAHRDGYPSAIEVGDDEVGHAYILATAGTFIELRSESIVTVCSIESLTERLHEYNTSQSVPNHPQPPRVGLRGRKIHKRS